MTETKNRYCLDGGVCHHPTCDAEGCFRTATSGPLSVFGENWPANLDDISGRQLVEAMERAMGTSTHHSTDCGCPAHAVLDALLNATQRPELMEIFSAAIQYAKG